jgi:hypothetical protein
LCALVACGNSAGGGSDDGGDSDGGVKGSTLKGRVSDEAGSQPQGRKGQPPVFHVDTNTPCLGKAARRRFNHVVCLMEPPLLGVFGLAGRLRAAGLS